MRPKGKLFALFAIFAAIGLVTASGAFTTVTAERTAQVNVAGDASALLAIQPGDGDNGDSYAQIQDNGTLELSLAGDFDNNLNSSDEPSGVNNNATTEIDNVINITNQGSQDIDLKIERQGGNKSAVTFYNGTTYNTNSNITVDSSTEDNSVALTPGDTVKVSMGIDTNSVNVGSDAELIDSVTIYANATGGGAE